MRKVEENDDAEDDADDVDDEDEAHLFLDAVLQLTEAALLLLTIWTLHTA